MFERFRNDRALVLGMPYSRRNMAAIVCAMWFLWASGNRLIHDGIAQTSQEVVDKVVAYIGELDALKNRSSANITGVEVRWSPPGHGSFNINYDASFQKHLMCSCTGIIIMNQVGDTLVSSIIQNKVHTEFAAEALACLKAVRMGLDLKLQEVIIEGDALSGYKTSGYKIRDGSVTSAYIGESKSLSQIFMKRMFKHVSRKGNETTHCLATEGLKRGRDSYLIGGVPDFAEPQVEEDRRNLY
ncbi:hypothetical protein Gotri_026240 [Gossypium trilobum]|uniref:RNase H type-1 domain-containing protein n=1 Tax=Gossypium trilobum TaxID=34281 RepID=A0A7J9FMN1_9ROSI|nr:hypothetical protein [Gossypium trilobum]